MGLESVLTNLDNMLAIADESNRHAAMDRKKDVLLIAKKVGEMSGSRLGQEHTNLSINEI